MYMDYTVSGHRTAVLLQLVAGFCMEYHAVEMLGQSSAALAKLANLVWPHLVYCVHVYILNVCIIVSGTGPCNL